MGEKLFHELNERYDDKLDKLKSELTTFQETVSFLLKLQPHNESKVGWAKRSRIGTNQWKNTYLSKHSRLKIEVAYLLIVT